MEAVLGISRPMRTYCLVSPPMGIASVQLERRAAREGGGRSAAKALAKVFGMIV
jgi:hypothetical protein